MRSVILTLCSLAILYFLTLPKPFQLKEGSIRTIAHAGTTFDVAYDYSDTEIYDNLTEQYMAFNDYVSSMGRDGDISDEINTAEEAFVNAFNTYSKNASIVKGSQKAEYLMSVKLDKFCYGKIGGGVTSDSKGWASGTVSVKDTITGETVAVFDFNKINTCPPGKAANELPRRRERGYQLIAGYLARTLNSAR